jgi:hypothetical protein
MGALHQRQGNDEWNREVAFTRALALELANRDEVRSIWLGANIDHDHCVINDIFQTQITTLEYDLSLSGLANAEVPQQTIQIKLGGGARPESRHQEALHFLGDCVYSVIDQALEPIPRRLVIAWLPQERIHNRWERLIPENDIMTITLNPELIVGGWGGLNDDSDWIDQEAGTIIPIRRDKVNMLLGKSTNPKIIGWHNRIPGHLSGRFRVTVLGNADNSRILVYELLAVDYDTGDLSLEEWLP